MASASQLPVLISGAGVASLLLAQALRHASVPFHIYERDASVSFRAQGYRLRLSTEGLDAIESVLPPDQWKEFWDTCGKTSGPSGGMGYFNAITGESADGGAMMPESATPKTGASSSGNGGNTGAAIPWNRMNEKLQSRGSQVVGIARGDMRKLFMKGVEDRIQWSHNVRGYERTADGVHAIFDDGSKSPLGSLLIGGEGIYSKVAKQVSGGKLKVYDTGARGIHGQAPTTAFKALGEGVWRIVDDENPKGRVAIITNVRPGEMDDPNEIFGWTMTAGPGVVNPPGDDMTVIGQPAADAAKDLTKAWHPSMRALVDQMIESEAAFWKITCSTPSGVPRWENDERVTVIGDAVHSMTPAGGIGANTAVRDSALLGKLIADAGGWREGLTKDYEDKMRVYGSEAVGISYGTASKAWDIKIDENSKTV